MNRELTFLVLVAFLLSACGSPTVLSTAQDQIYTAPSSAETTTTRSALLKEIEGLVEVRSTQSGDFSTAETGLVLYAGGEVRTGENGKARIDLAPEGTILRVTPNSSFTITELADHAGQPQSKLRLFFGKIFVLLNGGELQVATPSGVASVRGSLLGISVSPEGNITATCLEGHCSLEADGRIIKLTDGQAADIIDGEISDEARLMTEDETEDWQEENPELDEFIDEIPEAPTDVTTEEPVATEAPIVTEEPIATEPPAEEPTSEPTEPPAPE